MRVELDVMTPATLVRKTKKYTNEERLFEKSRPSQDLQRVYSSQQDQNCSRARSEPPRRRCRQRQQTLTPIFKMKRKFFIAIPAKRKERDSGPA